MKLLFILLYLIAFICVPLFEQLCINYIRRHRRKIVPYFNKDKTLKIHYLKNKGMMMGTLENNKKALIIITSIMVAILLVISIYVFLFCEELYILKIGLIIYCSGSFSNALERYIYGYVVDYFSFPNTLIKGLDQVVFNFADICIFIGVFVIVIGLFFI